MWTYKMLLSEEGWWHLLAGTDATYKWTFEASDHLWSLKSPSHLLEQKTIHHALYSNPIMDNRELTSLSRVCHPMLFSSLPVFIAHGCSSNSAEFFPRGASFQRPNDHSTFPSLWKSYKMTVLSSFKGKSDRVRFKVLMFSFVYVLLFSGNLNSYTIFVLSQADSLLEYVLACFSRKGPDSVNFSLYGQLVSATATLPL